MAKGFDLWSRKPSESHRSLAGARNGPLDSAKSNNQMYRKRFALSLTIHAFSPGLGVVCIAVDHLRARSGLEERRGGSCLTCNVAMPRHVWHAGAVLCGKPSSDSVCLARHEGRSPREEGDRRTTRTGRDVPRRLGGRRAQGKEPGRRAPGGALRSGPRSSRAPPLRWW